MAEFRGVRVHHQFTQTNYAPPDKVFPLLCPAREAEWVPDWHHRMIYSNSGVAELGCVFTTPNERGPDSVWVVTEYDPAAFRVGFAWVWPDMVAAQIWISLCGKSPETTEALIRYAYTGLSPEGNREVARYNDTWFGNKMQSWEKAINHYLKYGALIGAKAWE